MGSLWFHGNTICVSQGLTLSTASLVFRCFLLDISPEFSVELGRGSAGDVIGFKLDQLSAVVEHEGGGGGGVIRGRGHLLLILRLDIVHGAGGRALGGHPRGMG